MGYTTEERVDFDLLFRDLSGHTAERIHTGAVAPDWKDSRKAALEYWDEAYFYLHEYCPQILAERIIVTMEQYTEDFMRRQWPIVRRISEALLAQQTLTYGQVRDITLDTVLTSEPDQDTEPELEDLRNRVDNRLADLEIRDILSAFGPAESFRELSRWC